MSKLADQIKAKKKQRHYEQFSKKLQLKTREELVNLLFQASGAISFLAGRLNEKEGKHDHDDPSVA